MTPSLDFIIPLPRRPFVVGQLGQSLDGRIALPCGASLGINGPAALDHLHNLRAHVDAVMVGIGTVIADDPRLDVRRVEGTSPARIILDPRGRMDKGACCLREDGVRRIVIRADEPGPDMPAEVIVLPSDQGYLSPLFILEALFDRGIKSLLIEGGAKTLGQFLAAGLVDRLHLLVAPVILGAGKTGIDFPPPPNPDEALRPSLKIVPLPGGDVLFDIDLRENKNAA